MESDGLMRQGLDHIKFQRKIMLQNKVQSMLILLLVLFSKHCFCSADFSEIDRRIREAEDDIKEAGKNLKQLAKQKNSDEEKRFYRNRIDHLQKRIEDFQKEKANIHPAKGSSAYFGIFDIYFLKTIYTEV